MTDEEILCISNRDKEWLMALRISSPKGMTPKGAARFLEQLRQNELAEAERRWPPSCDCSKPMPGQQTPEPTYAWCTNCSGLLHLGEA